jgi:hypothetical protein
MHEILTMIARHEPGDEHRGLSPDSPALKSIVDSRTGIWYTPNDLVERPEVAVKGRYVAVSVLMVVLSVCGPEPWHASGETVFTVAPQTA